MKLYAPFPKPDIRHQLHDRMRHEVVASPGVASPFHPAPLESLRANTHDQINGCDTLKFSYIIVEDDSDDALFDFIESDCSYVPRLNDVVSDDHVTFGRFNKMVEVHDSSTCLQITAPQSGTQTYSAP
jgi:hypothetical protein